MFVLEAVNTIVGVKFVLSSHLSEFEQYNLGQKHVDNLTTHPF